MHTMEERERTERTVSKDRETTLSVGLHEAEMMEDPSDTFAFIAEIRDELGNYSPRSRSPRVTTSSGSSTRAEERSGAILNSLDAHPGIQNPAGQPYRNSSPVRSLSDSKAIEDTPTVPRTMPRNPSAIGSNDSVGPALHLAEARFRARLEDFLTKLEIRLEDFFAELRKQQSDAQCEPARSTMTLGEDGRRLTQQARKAAMAITRESKMEKVETQKNNSGRISSGVGMYSEHNADSTTTSQHRLNVEDADPWQGSRHSCQEEFEEVAALPLPARPWSTREDSTDRWDDHPREPSTKTSAGGARSTGSQLSKLPSQITAVAQPHQQRESRAQVQAAYVRESLQRISASTASMDSAKKSGGDRRSQLKEFRRAKQKFHQSSSFLKREDSRRLTVQQVFSSRENDTQSTPKGQAGPAFRKTEIPNDADLHRMTQAQNQPQLSACAKLVIMPAFDYFFACLIMLNAIFIGVQTEFQANNINASQDDPIGFEVIELIFVFFFTLELLCRIKALGLMFLTAKGRAWNIFDLALITMSYVDLSIQATTGQKGKSGTGGSVGKVIRLFRMARIVRIMRVLRFLAELRVMVTLIAHSMRSLFWLMILLCLILYVFAICFTQAGSDFRASPESEQYTNVAESIREYFGSLGTTVYTLFLAITNGISWHLILDSLAYTGVLFTALFLVYIFFAIFSVLNIVTGVFVDGAIQRSGQERDLRLEKEREQKEAYVSMLLDLLDEIDTEGKGTIRREELEMAFQEPRVQYYFRILEIDIAESSYLFDMLDVDRSGEVDYNEFVEGCARLKGAAKSIDVHTMMFEIKLMMHKWDRFMQVMATGVANEAGLPPDQSQDVANARQ